MEIRIRIQNSQASSRVLVLEPWAKEIELPAGETFTLVSEGDPAFPMELELLEDRVVIYAFDSQGATMCLYNQSGRKVF